MESHLISRWLLNEWFIPAVQFNPVDEHFLPVRIAVIFWSEDGEKEAKEEHYQTKPNETDNCKERK